MTTTKTPSELAMEAPRSARFHVAPRYTAGSPAMVDLATTVQVAEQEMESHERCLTGVYGEELKTTAKTRGLSWIAYARWEKGKKVFRLDLITGETIQEPPHLWHTDKERLRDLRNRKQFVGLIQETEQELKALEFRAMIHREEV